MIWDKDQLRRSIETNLTFLRDDKDTDRAEKVTKFLEGMNAKNISNMALCTLQDPATCSSVEPQEVREYRQQSETLKLCPVGRGVQCPYAQPALVIYD